MPERSRHARPVSAVAAKRQLTSNEVVVAAAVRCVERMGFEALTLSAVAKELRIRTPSLYKHVSGLDDLRQQVAQEGSVRLLACLREGVARQTGRDALVALGLAFRTFAKKHPGLYAATIETPTPERAEHYAVRDQMIALVGKVVASLEVPPNDLLHVTRALRAALHGFVSLELQGGLGRPLDVEESFRRMLMMFWQGSAL